MSRDSATSSSHLSGSWSAHQARHLTSPDILRTLRGYGCTKLESPVEQLGPRLALGWMTIKVLEVDAV